MSINSVSISGNLVREPEYRLAGQMPLLQGSVAVNERKKNGDNWEDYANFIDFTIFGKRAESLKPYLDKGTKVTIQGKLRQSRWEKDGQKRSRIEVIVDEIEFMSRNGERKGSESTVSASLADSLSALGATVKGETFGDSIPF